MSPDESIIFGKFLSLNSNVFDRFDYDLRVGTGIVPDTNFPEKFRKDYIAVTQKRIDAVGYNKQGATIIEVKTRASISVIGQLLGYRDLFNFSFPGAKVFSLLLICSQISDEDIATISNYDIKIQVFPS